ncbi:hypothetical protein Ddc_13730 [Ditylenchus destructor]|nr:hypothetical protein Ddc_13730 [Ditylenchus destructor]
MTAKKLQPSFAHFGIEGGVKDPSSRQIMGIGEWPFSNEDQIDIDENGASCSHEFQQLRIWIHFRGSAVEIFDCSANSTQSQLLRFNASCKVETAHYAFCRAVSDRKKSRFILPDYQNESNMLRIRYRKGGEKCFVLSEEFLNNSFIKRMTSTNPKFDAENAKQLRLFKGMLMAIDVNINPPSNYKLDQDRILLGFEDSTVAIFDMRTKEVIDCIKHPKHQQFLGLTSRATDDFVYIAVSVMTQVYMMKYSFGEEKLSVCCVITKSKSMNCSALEFCGNILACGFNNGFAEVYRIAFGTEEVETIAAIDFHEESIQTVKWITSSKCNENSTFKTREENATQAECKTNFLLIGSSDGKLSFYDCI